MYSRSFVPILKFHLRIARAFRSLPYIWDDKTRQLKMDLQHKKHLRVFMLLNVLYLSSQAAMVTWGSYNLRNFFHPPSFQLWSPWQHSIPFDWNFSEAPMVLVNTILKYEEGQKVHLGMYFLEQHFVRLSANRINFKHEMQLAASSLRSKQRSRFQMELIVTWTRPPDEKCDVSSGFIRKAPSKCACFEFRKVNGRPTRLSNFRYIYYIFTIFGKHKYIQGLQICINAIAEKPSILNGSWYSYSGHFSGQGQYLFLWSGHVLDPCPLSSAFSWSFGSFH